MSLTKSEFEEWWYHPVTKAFMATVYEEAVDCNSVIDVPFNTGTIEGVAMNVVALSNRAKALFDVTDKYSAKRSLGVDDDD